MPKTTFLKLKAEKKERLIEKALELFAFKDYEAVPVNTIVAVWGIAKGSFYQYFESKKDLYFYLVDYASQKKQVEVGQELLKPHQGFFELIEKMFLGSLLFDLQHPLIGAFLYNASRERNSNDLGNLQLTTKKQSMAYFKTLLSREIEKGNLRQDIEPELMAFFIVQLVQGINDFAELKWEFHPAKMLLTSTLLSETKLEEIRYTILRLSELLKNGILMHS